MPSWSSLSIWKRSLVTKSKGILGSKTVGEFRYYIHKKPEEKQDSPLSTQHKDPEKQFLVDWKRYLQQWFPTSSSFDKQTQFVLSFLSNVKTASVVDPMYLLDSFTRSSNRERLEREKRKALYEQVIEQLEKYDAYCTDVDEEIRNTTAMAFSGGGVLGNAYVGALSVLEKHGLDYSKITKLAGTSAGALTAAALAVGHNAESCNNILRKTGFKDLFYPEYSSVLARRGGSSGQKLEEFVGRVLEEKTGNPDITLKQVYDEYGKEVVCVATELDTLRERKFRYQTDPDLPVRHAVRMSSSVPIILEHVEYDGHVYVDGGLTNNFPVDELPDENGIGMVADTWEILAQMRYFIHLDNADPEERDLVVAMKERWEHVSREKRRIVSVFDVAFASIRCLVQNNFALRLRIADVEEINHEHMQPPRNWWLCVGDIDSFHLDLDQDKQLELYNNGKLSALFLIQSWMRRLKRKQLHIPKDEILEGDWKAPVDLLWQALSLVSLTETKPVSSSMENEANENKAAVEEYRAKLESTIVEQYEEKGLGSLTETSSATTAKKLLEDAEEEKSSLQEQLGIYETIIQGIRDRLQQLSILSKSDTTKENDEQKEDTKEEHVVHRDM
jgi:predicted acylesterase/phospholipase RssA